MLFAISISENTTVYQIFEGLAVLWLYQAGIRAKRLTKGIITRRSLVVSEMAAARGYYKLTGRKVDIQ